MVYEINTFNLEKYLDIPTTDDHYYKGINEELPIGTSNGLAFVNDGSGSVLKIQFVKNNFGKKEGTLTFTGMLGDVMKESVEVVKMATFNLLEKWEILNKETFDKIGLHLHIPQGAIPKDGPSAGVALFCALTSSIIQKPVKKNLAMTGEISTLGEVIAIGGVWEKLTACKNYRITNVILPYSNEKNFNKLPDEFKSGFTIYYVKTIEDVYKIAFTDDDLSDIKQISFPVDHSLDLNFIDLEPPAYDLL